MALAKILGTGWNEKTPDVVIASVEHPAIKPGRVARAELEPEDALRIARGLIAGIEKVEQHRAVGVTLSAAESDLVLDLIETALPAWGAPGARGLDELRSLAARLEMRPAS